MNDKKLLIVAALSSTLLSNNTFACSRLLWNNDQAVVVARTMDLYMNDKARIAVFPRGITRGGGDGMLSWSSKYGSVSATALDAAVSDGLNEKGLSVNLLYLHDTKYEPRDKRPGVSNMLWAQWILDNFSDVTEAIEGTKNIQIVSSRVSGRDWPLHMSVADSKGDSAIFEFINGKLHIIRGPQSAVMTNEPPLDVQIKNLKRYRLFGGKLTMPGDIDPLSRFVRASSYLKTLPKPTSILDAVAGAYSVARNISVPFGAQDTSGGNSADTWPTLWSSVADTTHGTYYFQSTRSPNVFWVDLNKTNLTEGAPVVDVDAYDASLSGEITERLQPSKLKI
jgi:penicillin V acylase-like amidase (Ntn superfamily)